MSAADIELLRQQIAEIKEDTTEIKEILTGNGDPSKGLIVRVDRLEVLAEQKDWLKKTVLGGILMSAIALAFELISKFKS